MEKVVEKVVEVEKVSECSCTVISCVHEVKHVFLHSGYEHAGFSGLLPQVLFTKLQLHCSQCSRKY